MLLFSYSIENIHGLNLHYLLPAKKKNYIIIAIDLANENALCYMLLPILLLSSTAGRILEVEVEEASAKCTHHAD